MALAETTLSVACAATDNSITVASATSVAAKRIVVVDGEVMQVQAGYVSGTSVPVLRGQEGTLRVAHAVSARVVHGEASDFGSSLYPTPYSPRGWGRKVVSYSAAGAIELPSPGEDRIVILNGTDVLAMTLANPTKDLDGCVLTIAGNGAAAHTVTYTAGVGGAGNSYDVFTCNATAPASFKLIAINELWYLESAVTGTLTNNAWALA